MAPENFKDKLCSVPKDNIGLFGNFGFRVYDLVNGEQVLKLRVQKKNQIFATKLIRAVLLHSTLIPGNMRFSWCAARA